MRPNPEHIRKLLAAFEDSPDPTTDIEELEKQGLSYQTSDFYFHLRLLNDQDFVVRDNGESGIGTAYGAASDYSWSVVPLRLTASGHEFAEALSNNKAFETVKKSLVNASLGTMRDIAVSVFRAELARHGLPLGG